MNENRKLATLQRVLDVSPIENADFIEKIKIMGWNVVVKKKMNLKLVILVFISRLIVSCQKFQNMSL